MGHFLPARERDRSGLAATLPHYEKMAAVEIELKPIDIEEGTMVLTAIVDITERKAAGLRLRVGELRLRSILEPRPADADAATPSQCRRGWFARQTAFPQKPRRPPSLPGRPVEHHRVR